MLSTPYTLGESDAEHRRLIALASHEEEYVRAACRRAGITVGATAIDLGCGPLGALAALLRVVGDDGRVIGVDASAAALVKARELLPESSFPQLRLVHADVNELTPAKLGDSVIDLAYSRLMLPHQADPAATLGRIAQLLLPGAMLIAHEPSDLATHAPSSEPEVPAMSRVWQLVIAAAQARGAKTDFGRRGRAYLEDAGFEIVGQSAYFVHYPPAIGYEIPRVALHSLGPVLDEHRLASAEERVSLDRELEEAKGRTDVQWVTSPLMIEWIARRT
jgi:ubiquinone/menaquinone biosynthesis C-methylase UbiE